MEKQEDIRVLLQNVCNEYRKILAVSRILSDICDEKNDKEFNTKQIIHTNNVSLPNTN